jgi:hypothetical protein
MLASSADSSGSSFGWLEGCWVSEDQSSREVWVVDDETSLIGFSIALDAGKVVFYEVLSIRLNGDGSWRYNAHPSGQESAAFVASEPGENSVVFVNPDHDYPQEIRYRRDGNRLYASIALLGGIEPNSFDKVACE